MARKSTKKSTTRPRRPRRYGGEGGYVQKIYGDGPYAVQYGVSDSQGYVRKVAMPHSPLQTTREWASLDHVRRFKTLRGAVGFFLKQYDKMNLPEIYLWGSRHAVPMSTPDETGRYDGGRNTFSVEDLKRFYRKSGTSYYVDDLIKEVELTLVRKPRR